MAVKISYLVEKTENLTGISFIVIKSKKIVA